MTDEVLSADVIVVGGGMVGAALALGLGQAGFRVLLLEQRPPPDASRFTGFDIRVSAITRASQRIFENLGVWHEFAALRITPYEKMRVWDQAGFGEIAFDAGDIGEPDLGHIVENRVMLAGLWSHLRASDNVFPLFGAEITAVTRDADTSIVHLGDGRQLSGALLVAADGARSQVRSLAGISVRERAYGQEGVVATVRSDNGNQSTAWQRFLPNGPLALLPIADRYFSIVWSTTPQESSRLLKLEDEAFNAELSAASEFRAGRLSVIGQRAAFPLRMLHADSYVRPGLALVGDAAHVIHPLAGQGVNLGLLDAGILVDVLTEAKQRHHGLGELGVLRRYERGRKGHNLAVQSAMTVFQRLFSNDMPPLKFMRNLGMGLAAHVTPLRRQFERAALGDFVDLPRLAKKTEDDIRG